MAKRKQFYRAFWNSFKIFNIWCYVGFGAYWHKKYKTLLETHLTKEAVVLSVSVADVPLVDHHKTHHDFDDAFYNPVAAIDFDDEMLVAQIFYHF